MIRDGTSTDLRRLFSTFAGSWPGAGLLLLRLVIGSVLLLRAGSRLSTDGPLHSTLAFAALAVSGLLLIAGLWTPLAGAVLAAVGLSCVLAWHADWQVHLLAGTIGASLAMVGPGRWSVDARLFGWKRIEAPRYGSAGQRSTSVASAGGAAPR